MTPEESFPLFSLEGNFSTSDWAASYLDKETEKKSVIKQNNKYLEFYN